MKNLLPIISLLLMAFVFSCRSIEKLVDRGRYDEAIDLAIKDLQGPKHIRTKHVRALEDGFDRIKNQDLKRITYLRNESDESKWDRIYAIITRIEDRQRKLDLILPIVSDEGYVATFEFIKTTEMKSEATANAAGFHFRLANNYILDFERTKRKDLARAAYNEAQITYSYDNNFDGINAFLDRAHHDGMTNVLVKWDPNFIDFMMYGSSVLEGSGFRQFQDGFWVHFYTSFEEGVMFDAVAQLSIRDIIISPEREEIIRREEIRTFEYVEDLVQAGDSSTVSVNQKREISTKVFITEIRRIKEVLLDSQLELRDFESGSLLRTEDHQIVEKFDTWQSEERIYEEDIPYSILKKFPKNKGRLDPFPSDNRLLYNGAKKLNKKFNRFINQIREI